MYKLKKFKTVEELEKAYAELEAAFTRKCQEASQAQTELNRTKQQQEQSQSMQTLANEPENALVSEETHQNALTDVQPAEAAVPQEKEGKDTRLLLT